MRGFHRTFATGVACWQGTLTPSDTWSRPSLDLTMFFLLRPILFPTLFFFLPIHFEHPSELSWFCLRPTHWPRDLDLWHTCHVRIFIENTFHSNLAFRYSYNTTYVPESQPYVKLILQYSCTFICCHIHDCNIVYFDVKQEKKEEILLSPMTKAPAPTEKSKKQRDNTKNATKKIDYTTIADRLRTVSWRYNSHQTGEVKPVFARSTFPVTATTV